MLVVIAVIALLAALAIPSLARARADARAAVCLSNLHGLGQTMEQYLARYSQRYPFAPAGQLWKFSPDGGGIITSNQFDFRLYWQTTMHDIAPWPESFRAWVCPGSPRLRTTPWILSNDVTTGLTSYALASGFFADPKVWAGGSAADKNYLRAVAASEIIFPSSKTMMYDYENSHDLPNVQPDPIPQLFADGHASIRRISDASAPVSNPFTGSATPINDTRNGAAGADY